MTEPEEISNEEVERCFTEWNWKYRQLPQKPGAWELSFQMRTTMFTIFVDNGLSNPAFISVGLLYLKPQTNHQAVFQQLLRNNGNVLFSKFVLDNEGNIWVRGVTLRFRPSFTPEKMKHAIGAVLQAADHWYVEKLNMATQGAS